MDKKANKDIPQTRSQPTNEAFKVGKKERKKELAHQNQTFDLRQTRFSNNISQVQVHGGIKAKQSGRTRQRFSLTAQ